MGFVLPQLPRRFYQSIHQILEDEQVTSPLETKVYFADQISEEIVSVWKHLESGKIYYGLDRVSIEFVRRACYINGRTRM